MGSDNPFFWLAILAVICNLGGFVLGWWNLHHIMEDRWLLSALQINSKQWAVLDEQRHITLMLMMMQALMFIDRIPGLVIAPRRYQSLVDEFWWLIVGASMVRLLTAFCASWAVWKMFVTRNYLLEEVRNPDPSTPHRRKEDPKPRV